MVSKGLDRFVLWPHYFDAQRTRAQGRRVRAEHAVKRPDAPWVEVAAKRMGLDPQLEDKVAHPSLPYERTGRVLVTRKGPKQALLEQIGAKMRESQDNRERQ